MQALFNYEQMNRHTKPESPVATKNEEELKKNNKIQAGSNDGENVLLS